MRWFKHRRHKWIPCYIWGVIRGKEVKVIVTYCEKCRCGNKEMMDLIHELDKTYCATYNKEYFYIEGVEK